MDFIYIAGVDEGVNFYVDDILLSKVIPAVNPEDTDSDGMLDSWEQSSFGNLDSLPNEDFDNDGFSNILEYRSGTDPNNLGSFFKVLNSNFSHGGSQDTLQWLGHPSKQYRVLSKTDLSTSQWDIEEEAIDGSISTFNIWNGNHLGNPSKFYKIEIDQ
jgi:hypothetical protein